MSYSSFGAAVSEVEIDVLTGEKLVLQSDIHFDCGRSLNPAVDMGQVHNCFNQCTGSDFERRETGSSEQQNLQRHQWLSLLDEHYFLCLASKFVQYIKPSV